jgi:hypothetical protein
MINIDFSLSTCYNAAVQVKPANRRFSGEGMSQLEIKNLHVSIEGKEILRGSQRDGQIYISLHIDGTS